MLRELVENQQKFFSHFWQGLDLSATEKLVHKLLSCEGSLIFTGVGKSGLIAQKIAMTLTSTGTKAFYMCPLNAMHGDIGQISPKDICLMLSKSGESDELLALLPQLKQRSIPSIALVSEQNSRLSRSCDETIFLPVLQELCPFNLVPTTSAAVQLLFGDLLAISLLRLRNFTLEDYALNHPSGKIGKKIFTRVKDLMLTGEKLPLCLPSQRLVDTLVELSNKQCGCVLIHENQKLLGLFTDGDLRRALQKLGPSALDMPIEELMTLNPRTISPDALAWNALQAMESDPGRPINVMPVINESTGAIAGLIKMHDLIQKGISTL